MPVQCVRRTDPHGIKQITVGPPHGIKQITMFIRENVELPMSVMCESIIKNAHSCSPLSCRYHVSAKDNCHLLFVSDQFYVVGQ
ncbi:hypothetical protein J6590_054434 [Homalodisca vitripennis]|nr:hypothetical protein J6590_054434 [Homalodisca vitripennis]